MKRAYGVFLTGIIFLLLSYWSFYNVRFTNFCGCPEANKSWLEFVKSLIGFSSEKALCVLPVCRTSEDPHALYFYSFFLGILLIILSIILWLRMRRDR